MSETLAAAPALHGPAARSNVLRALRRCGAILALALVCVFAGLRYPAFLSPENLLNVLRQNSMIGFVALGMTWVILSGGIDLSVGSLAAIAGVVAASVAGHGAALAVACGIAAAGLLGLLNGVLVAKARLQPFIVTLATMIAGRGVALAATHEQSVRVARTATAFLWLGRGRIGPVPVPVLLLLLAYGVGAAALRYTRFGRHVYALGDSEEAARLMGLRVEAITVGVYTLSGALAGAAGVLLASRLGAGQPVAGLGWELDAIAAVVVGGTLLTGGEGGAGSTLVGVLLLGLLFNILNLEGTLSPYWQGVLRGACLLVFVLLQRRPAAGSAER